MNSEIKKIFIEAKLNQYYNNVCDITNKLIEKYEDLDFKLIFDDEHMLYHMIINNKIDVVIRDDNTFDEIERKLIHSVYNYSQPIDCFICNTSTCLFITCPKCETYICNKCHKKIHIEGKGIFNCPKCEYQMGIKLNRVQLRKSLIKMDKMYEVNKKRRENL